MSEPSTKTIFGWKHLREAIVCVDDASYFVTYGTVDDGTLKGERGIALINSRAPWHFEAAFQDKLKKELML